MFESRGARGLGLLKGSVVRFREKDFSSKGFQIPHMGWNAAAPLNGAAKLFKGISEDDYFYFVHSYYPVPDDGHVVATKTKYGKPFCSSILTESMFASQFHLEKSGDIGLRLLKNVLGRFAQ